MGEYCPRCHGRSSGGHCSDDDTWIGATFDEMCDHVGREGALRIMVMIDKSEKLKADRVWAMRDR